MDTSFLTYILSIPSCSNHEEFITEKIIEWCGENGIKTKKDGKGNLYLTKGTPKSGEFYVGATAHLDTVHDDQIPYINEKKLLEPKVEGDKVTMWMGEKQTGTGSDDKNAIAIILSIMKQTRVMKAAFFVGEEIGMVGSKASDMSFWDDVAWVFGCDSPGPDSRATKYTSGIKLFTDDFFEKYLGPVCKKHGITDFRSEPYTDLATLIRRGSSDGKFICSCNLRNGGENAHTQHEWCSISTTNDTEKCGLDLIAAIPLDKRYVMEKEEEPRPSYSWSGYSGGSYAGKDWWKQWLGGRDGAEQQTFDFGQSEEETGSFEWNFKDPDAARLALDRLPKMLGGVKAEKKEGNLVRVSGPKSKLRTAFRFSYNYDNKGQPGVPYKYDTAFYRDVPSASDAFEQRYEPDEKEAKAGDPKGNPDAPCAISIYFAEADVLTDFMKALNDRKNPVEVDDDGYSACTVSGRLEDVKAAYVEYVNSDAGGKRKFDRFEQLPKQDRKAFWEDVEFAETGMEGDDDVIDADYTMVDMDRDSAPPAEPEKKADDDLWDWWK